MRFSVLKEGREKRPSRARASITSPCFVPSANSLPAPFHIPPSSPIETGAADSFRPTPNCPSFVPNYFSHPRSTSPHLPSLPLPFSSLETHTDDILRQTSTPAERSPVSMRRSMINEEELQRDRADTVSSLPSPPLPRHLAFRFDDNSPEIGCKDPWKLGSTSC